MFRSYTFRLVVTVAIMTLANQVALSHVLAKESDVVVKVSGSWEYLDKNNNYKFVKYARIEILDKNPPASDFVLGKSYTDSSGKYTITVTSTKSSGSNIAVRVCATDDESVFVGTSSSIIDTYCTLTDTRNNVISPTLDFGTYVVLSASNREAFYIHGLIADLAWRSYLKPKTNFGSYCAVPGNSCLVAIRWAAGSTDGSYFDLPGDGAIHLRGDDRYDPDVILHEYSHFVMDRVYFQYPSSPNCNPHSWDSVSSRGCAWTEGWADFLQAAIQNDGNYDDGERTNPIHFDLEFPLPFVSGFDSESAVTASLWDIFDNSGTSEAWDKISLDMDGTNNNGIWSVFRVKPSDALEFETEWRASKNGFNCEVRGIFAHHIVGSGLYSCNYMPIVLRR